MLGRFLQETRSAHACAVQTRIHPVHFSHFFAEICFFYCARALFLSAQACAPEFPTKRYPLTPVRSKHASAHPTLECVFHIRYNALVCCASALLYCAAVMLS